MNPENKDGALETLRAEFARWEALLGGLSAAQITAPQLDEGWSVKDVVAHLWTWQQRSVARLEAARDGHEPVYPAWPTQLDPELEDQPHALNAWLYQATRDQPWPQIYASWHANFTRFLELAAALSEADLLEQDRYPWLPGYALIEVLHGTAEHHAEHAEYLAPLLVQPAPTGQ